MAQSPRQVGFDYERARQELENAARWRAESPLATDHPWRIRLKAFCEAADASAKTHIAMLGTALLARATDATADLSRLKIVSESPGSYYARGLADSVLAKVAPLIGINLGANGANPLNNMPYRGPATLSDVTVRSDIKPLYDELLGILSDVSVLDPEAARTALQAFVEVRSLPRASRVALPNASTAIAPGELARGIKEFVTSDSEGGKRAQAVAAAVLDARYADTDLTVHVFAVNDPSRKYPGDVAITSDSELLWSLEVRDKAIDLAELVRFVEKVADKGVARAAILAVDPAQTSLSVSMVERRAEDLGVHLRVYRSWSEILTDAVHHARQHPVTVRESITTAIYSRAQELSVSKKGLAQWRDINLAIRSSPSQ